MYCSILACFARMSASFAMILSFLTFRSSFSDAKIDCISFSLTKVRKKGEKRREKERKGERKKKREKKKE
jgi:hypothetical protein